MRPTEVKRLLLSVRDGEIDADEALEALRRLPVDDMGFATLDTHRELRQGMPEAILAESKTADQVAAIAARLLETTTGAVLATRCRADAAAALLERWPDAVYEPSCGLVVLREESGAEGVGTTAVVAAGTSDLPVAEEAAGVLKAVGATVLRATDVGVAGVHRILAVEDELRASHVVIVVAGMDGALPSMVGGITPAPVIAVPTSVGYGASFEGLAALLTMLNSCAAGVVVTNIDNGFGAAMAALRLLRTRR
jgi:NCAIR mutase (PurE)-related protein